MDSKPPKLKLNISDSATKPNNSAPTSGSASLHSPIGSPKKHHHGLFHHHSGSKTGFGPFRPHLRAPAAVTELSKFASKGPISTRGTVIDDSPSKRQSLPISEGNESATARNRYLGEVEILKEKELNRRRDQELRKSLDRLLDVAQQSARKLDFTYYTILEKSGSLYASIREIQELSAAANSASDDFEKDANEVETSFDSQIDNLNVFEQRKKRLVELETRIEAGVSQADGLNTRLEQARSKADLWEKRENEWQARTSSRLRIGWVTTTIIILLILVLVTMRHFSVFGSRLQDTETSSIPSLTDHGNGVNQLFRELRLLVLEERRKPFSLPEVSQVSSDSRFRILDEL